MKVISVRKIFYSNLINIIAFLHAIPYNINNNIIAMIKITRTRNDACFQRFQNAARKLHSLIMWKLKAQIVYLGKKISNISFIKQSGKKITDLKTQIAAIFLKYSKMLSEFFCTVYKLSYLYIASIMKRKIVILKKSSYILK